MKSALSSCLALIILALAPCAAPLAAQEVVGGVYAMTNAAGGNEIALYRRFDDGTLDGARYYSTGGRGTGGTYTTRIDPLGSQGSLVLTEDGRWLLAVNARSDEVSVLRVRPNRLELTDVAPARGAFPASVAVSGDLVYVLSAGGTGRLVGFKLDSDGRLDRLAGAARSLELALGNPPRLADSPAQVSFSPGSEHLVVALKGTDEILVFALDEDGRPAAEPVRNPSSGEFPFGFTFDRRGHLLVTEIFGGSDGRGAVSSYELTADGDLLAIDPSVGTFQSATCWIVEDGGRYAFVTNTSSGTVSTFRIRRNGSLRLRGRSGYTAGVAGRDSFPIDAATTPDGDFLYVLNAGSGTVAAHAVDRQGRLELIDEVGGLPANDGAQGIAAQ